MTTELQIHQKPLPEAIERALIEGDLKPLSAEMRVVYYNSLCDSLGLNPLTKPFLYITLNGKLQLYAAKDCTDQIRNIKAVSVIELTGKLDDDGGIYTVTAKGQDKSGRIDAATGAVNVKGLSGETRANAYMKAETKAKRRLTLSLCGLGMLDESEVDSIPGAKREAFVEVPTTKTESAPGRIIDEDRQSKAGEEDQRPREEQQRKPAGQASGPDQGDTYLEAFKRDGAKTATVSELTELWEGFRKLLQGAGLSKERIAELENAGWAWRKAERTRRAGA